MSLILPRIQILRSMLDSMSKMSWNIFELNRIDYIIIKRLLAFFLVFVSSDSMLTSPLIVFKSIRTYGSLEDN